MDFCIARDQDTIQGDIGDEDEKMHYNNLDHLSRKYRGIGVNMPMDPGPASGWIKTSRK